MGAGAMLEVVPGGSSPPYCPLIPWALGRGWGPSPLTSWGRAARGAALTRPESLRLRSSLFSILSPLSYTPLSGFIPHPISVSPLSLSVTAPSPSGPLLDSPPLCPVSLPFLRLLSPSPVPWTRPVSLSPSLPPSISSASPTPCGFCSQLPCGRPSGPSAASEVCPRWRADLRRWRGAGCAAHTEWIPGDGEMRLSGGPGGPWVGAAGPESPWGRGSGLCRGDLTDRSQEVRREADRCPCAAWSPEVPAAPRVAGQAAQDCRPSVARPVPEGHELLAVEPG